MQTYKTQTPSNISAHTYIRLSHEGGKQKHKTTVHDSTFLSGGAPLSLRVSRQMCVCVILANSNSFVTVKNGGLVYGASKAKYRKRM